MASDERLTTSLQESVLTLLCFNEAHGAIAAGLLNSSYFEHPYKDIADKAIEYRRRFKKPPGEAHIDDLFDHVLGQEDSRQTRVYRDILGALMQQAKSLNAEYVASRITEFIKRQTLKGAIHEAGQRYMQGGDDFVVEVELILSNALKLRPDSIDSGIFLNDHRRALDFLEHNSTDAFRLGIEELDRRGLGPTAQEMLLYLAPAKSGKSWFCTHVGKQCLLQKAKVVDLTLEMSEARKIQRYYQMLFAIAKRDEEFETTFFEFDELDRLNGFRRKENRPVISLDNPDVRRFLSKKLTEWGGRLGNLVVKQFPTKALTVAKLNAYLDTLDTTFHFIPNVLIVDYPDLMWTDKNNPRISLGRTFEDLRGLAQERNLALVCPTQTSKVGYTSSIVGGEHVAEDFSKIMTADTVVTYSRTKQEQQLKLARLTVEAARNDEDKFVVLISQNYTTGQYVLQSTRMGPKYWDHVKRHAGDLDNDPGDDGAT